jgi:hypothetical protein
LLDLNLRFSIFLILLFSVYFRLFPYPNNFWLFGFSLSLWSVQLEQFFFLTLEQFFFQYWLLQFLLESFQVEVLIRVLLSSTKIQEVKVERVPWPGIEPGSFRSEDGRSTIELMILLLFACKNSYCIYLYASKSWSAGAPVKRQPCTTPHSRPDLPKM